jgi:fucose permease
VKPERGAIFALCFAAFACFGLVLVLIGANQAEIASDLQLDLMRSGLLGSALALGLAVGVVGAGPLFDRGPRRPLFMGSTLLAAASLLGVDSTMSYERLLLHLVFIGVGIGAYDTFISALIVEEHGERAARPMVIVHAAATLGAMIGPVLFGALTEGRHWTASFWWTGAAHLAIAFFSLFISFPARTTRPRAERSSRSQTGVRAILTSRAIIPFAAVAFAYVGVEACMTLFAIPYASGSLELSEARGRFAISGFWCGLLLGRVAVAALPGRIGPGLLILAGALACGCVVAGVGSASPYLVSLFAVTGLVLGGVFPLMIALVGHQFPDAPGTAAGLAAGAGALGGLLVPWLTGWIGDEFGVAIALGSLALWSLAIAAGGGAASRLPPPRLRVRTNATR